MIEWANRELQQLQSNRAFLKSGDVSFFNGSARSPENNITEALASDAQRYVEEWLGLMAQHSIPVREASL